MISCNPIGTINQQSGMIFFSLCREVLLIETLKCHVPGIHKLPILRAINKGEGIMPFH